MGSSKTDAFKIHCLSAPQGFSSAITSINSLHATYPEALTRLVSQVCQSLEHATLTQLQIQNILQDFEGELEDFGSTEVKNAISGLEYMYRGCLSSNLDSLEDTASALGSCTLLSLNARECIAAGLIGSRQLSNEEVVPQKPQISGATLVKIDFQVGVAVASKHCQNLMTPFIEATFHVRDTKGQIQVHMVEMTYAEFQALRRSMHEASSILEIHSQQNKS